MPAARFTIALILAVATVALVGLVTQLENSGLIERESVATTSTPIPTVSADIITETAFLADSSMEHKVMTSLVELRAYCILARRPAMNLFISESSADNGLVAFIKLFGKALPTKDEIASLTAAQMETLITHPFNIGKHYNNVIAEIKEKFSHGIPKYLVSHLATAVSSGKSLMTSLPKTDKHKKLSVLSGKAFGLGTTPVYFKKLAVPDSKVQELQVDILKQAKEALATKHKFEIKDKVSALVNADLDLDGQAEAKRADEYEQGVRAVAKEEQEQAKKVAEEKEAVQDTKEEGMNTEDIEKDDKKAEEAKKEAGIQDLGDEVPTKLASQKSQKLLIESKAQIQADVKQQAKAKTASIKQDEEKVADEAAEKVSELAATAEYKAKENPDNKELVGEAKKLTNAAQVMSEFATGRH